MTQERIPVVRLTGEQDAHADSISRGRRLETAGQRHLVCPKPPGAGGPDGTLVVEIDGAVVGRAIAEGVYPPFGELQNMNVARPWRGRGAGGALVDECIRQLGRRGFSAVFCQTHFENPAAHRLYARKGFLPVARGKMLRLLRWISYPLLEEFLHDHPLALYRPAEATTGREWPMTWTDWATGEGLTITLTGGSSDKDSDDVGPGISGVEVRSGVLSFAAHLSGPAEADPGETIPLRLRLSNRAGQRLAVSARLLLPPGFQPCAQWERRGPALKVEPSGEVETAFEVALGPDLKPIDPREAAFISLPLTAEVFAGGTSCWLTHSLMLKGAPRAQDS